MLYPSSEVSKDDWLHFCVCLDSKDASKHRSYLVKECNK